MAYLMGITRQLWIRALSPTGQVVGVASYDIGLIAHKYKRPALNLVYANREVEPHSPVSKVYQLGVHLSTTRLFYISYDKIGHFVQGLVPALIAREFLIRKKFISAKRIASFLSLCVAMCISAWYEIFEWLSALALSQGANEFLGTQGDPWDTQSDMFLAFIGASLGILFLAHIQDCQIKNMDVDKTISAFQ